ncbi:putative membrane protein [Elizabethkingia sp. YR214]|uniref:anthrone oxygenase family protein n=1 Tax=Elizabethkingia sp. YR214 TaxID=2135667 RepID=UPI000D302158|nr:anthrone oxygenase family protein [Elizabethkingia sp. YR214]PUB30697.1 putative membrane protein [Elizabethkingia sp. YR214]
MKFQDITLILTGITTALMAGLFFSYSVSVNLGLGKLADKEYLQAMQSINREILNPIFFVCFFGALISLPIATFQQYHHNQTMFLLLLLASLFYIIGVFGITSAFNVPLNNKLDLLDLTKASDISVKQMRNSFEKPWNNWNTIRTFSAVMSATLIIIACVCRK